MDVALQWLEADDTPSWTWNEASTRLDVRPTMRRSGLRTSDSWQSCSLLSPIIKWTPWSAKSDNDKNWWGTLPSTNQWIWASSMTWRSISAGRPNHIWRLDRRSLRQILRARSQPSISQCRSTSRGCRRVAHVVELARHEVLITPSARECENDPGELSWAGSWPSPKQWLCLTALAPRALSE